MTRSQLVKVSPRKFCFRLRFGPFVGFVLTSVPPYRYQLAVVNNGIINDDCSNLILDQKICLGYEGADCTTVYSGSPARFLTGSVC